MVGSQDGLNLTRPCLSEFGQAPVSGYNLTQVSFYSWVQFDPPGADRSMLGLV